MKQCESTVDALIFGVIRCHCPRHGHPGPHYSVQDTERFGRTLLQWDDSAPGISSIPLVIPESGQ